MGKLAGSFRVRRDGSIINSEPHIGRACIWVVGANRILSDGWERESKFKENTAVQQGDAVL